MGTRFLLGITLFSLAVFASCTTTNKIAYFQNAYDTTYKQMLGNVEAPLEANDFISISIISAKNADAADIFRSMPTNEKKNTGTAKATNPEYIGYLISADGYIEIPNLGKIKAAGITKTQLKNNLTKSILDTKLILEPMVDIRRLNFEVTVLGEVGNPTVISVPSEKISLVKALGMAGDITIYGKRDNVLLIREEAGVRKTRHINLNSSDFLNSEFYYLKPNDVIYVEPNKAKVAVSGRSQQVLPMALSSLSILVFVLDKVIK
jgi:polysaccharide biosynthesis/export protein